ncbi:MAG: AmmeMemoRadiSam system protein B [Desulfopila sp.]
MIRQPAVAGRFYPDNPQVLAQVIRDLSPASAPVTPQQGIAAMVPHAGYAYSGAVAAETFAALAIPPTVILLGLNHRGLGAPIALSVADWQMPMGTVRVNRELGQRLVGKDSLITVDEQAHRTEHSIEVQLPFLQAIHPSSLTIVPIVVSHLSYRSCEELATTLATTIDAAPEEILLVASTDMSHYEPRQSATPRDTEVLQQIERLDPRGVYDLVHSRNISMCGIIPVTVTLLAAKALGATTAKLIRYTDSGEASGDLEQVVGYAGMIIH